MTHPPGEGPDTQLAKGISLCPGEQTERSGFSMLISTGPSGREGLKKEAARTVGNLHDFSLKSGEEQLQAVV